MITNMLVSLYEDNDFWNTADLEETCNYSDWLKFTHLAQQVMAPGR